MWKLAIEYAVEKTRNNSHRFGEFSYPLSSIAQWIIEKNEAARELTT
jgi:hypothetical protein